MAEKIVSPGVFTRENDFSFVPQGIAEIGAAIIGPTVKGPGNVPTTVNSFAEYDAIFGTTFDSGSKSFEYMTSLAAELYLKHYGTLTVVRVMTGSYGPASASVTCSAGGTAASFVLKTIGDGTIMNSSGSQADFNILENGISFFAKKTKGNVLKTREHYEEILAFSAQFGHFGGEKIQKK